MDAWLKKGTPIRQRRTDPAGRDEGVYPEPAEGVCPICQGVGYVYSSAPLGHPDFGKAVPCQCAHEEEKEQQLTRLQRYSNLGPLVRLTFDSLNPQSRSKDPANQERFRRAVAAAKAFAQDPKGWLVLIGPSGSGKTHLAAAVANHCIQEGSPTFFIAVPDLLDHLRATFRPESDVSYDELFEQVRDAPILIMDDLGAHTTTPWAQEKLFQLLNHRYSAQLPTVITTSLSLDHLDERIKVRVEDLALSQGWVLEERQELFLQYEGSQGAPALRAMAFDNFDIRGMNATREQQDGLKTAFWHAQSFAQAPEGWLVLLGVSGCGKTHLAAAIANYAWEQGKPALFAEMPELLDHLRRAFAPDSKASYELFEAAKTAPLLILDDFVGYASTPWALEKLYQLINYRYNTRLPTVFTSTLSLDEVAELDARLSSRMGDPRLSTVIHIDAPDYRGGKKAQYRKPAPRRRGPSRLSP